MTWTIHDFYCGIGGFTCSVIEYLKSINMPAENVEFHGWEVEGDVLAVWAQNVRNAGFVAVPHNEDIGPHTKFPDATDTTVVHFSPPCQAHSRARSLSKATVPTERESSFAAQTMRLVLNTILEKGYKRWSVENVHSKSVKKIVDEFERLHPSKMRIKSFCASNFGCPSARMRFFVAPDDVITKIANHPTSSTSVVDAFAEHNITPAGTHIANANVDCGEPRAVTGRSFTVLASHPLTWKRPLSTGIGFETVRGLSVKESAILMSFPGYWKTNGERKALGLRGIGNAIAPAFGRVLAKYLFEFELTTTSPPEASDLVEPGLAQLVHKLEGRVRKLERRLKRMREE